MKVRPLKSYREPAYPTITAAGCARDLLSRIPRRWQNSPRFCALLGVGLMVKTLMAGGETSPSAGSQTPKTQSPSDSNNVPKSPELAQRVRKATTLVAPVLAEALQHDGQGAIGCIAVNPPTFLSETEALELIRNELKAAGLQLKPGVEVDGIMAPDTSTPGIPKARRSAKRTELDVDVLSALKGTDTAAVLVRPAGEIKARNWPRMGDEPREPPLVSRKFVFDFADPNRSVYVEYFSPKDYTTWMDRSMSPVQTYDFPALTRKVSESFAKHKSDKRTVFGIFFDPLVIEYFIPDTTGPDRSRRQMTNEEYQKARKQAWEQRAHEKLRKQVQYFVKFLQQEGIVPTPVGPSSATSKSRPAAGPESPGGKDQAQK